jgi:hypothetical protein
LNFALQDLPKMLRYLIFTCCTFLTTTLVHSQGPLDGYLKGAGHLDLAPSFSWLTARQLDGADGQVYDESFRGNLLSLFAEYGITERFDLVATLPYTFTSTQNGLQDGGLYVKYRPVLLESAHIGRLGVVLGTGVSGPLSNYEPTAAGAIGQRAVLVPARLIAQWETPLGVFFNLTGGWNWRLDHLKEADIARIRQQRPGYNPNDPPHYATFLGKIGFPSAHYYLDAWYEWQYTPNNAGADYVPNVPDLPQAYGVSYSQIGGTAYYSENGRRGVYLSGGYILGGRNTSRILRLTVGAVFKL